MTDKNHYLNLHILGTQWYLYLLPANDRQGNQTQQLC